MVLGLCRVDFPDMALRGRTQVVVEPFSAALSDGTRLGQASGRGGDVKAAPGRRFIKLSSLLKLAVQIHIPSHHSAKPKLGFRRNSHLFAT